MSWTEYLPFVGAISAHKNFLTMQQEHANKLEMARQAFDHAKNPDMPEEMSNALYTFGYGTLQDPKAKLKNVQQNFANLMAQVGMAQQKKRQEAEDQASQAQAMESMRRANTPVPGMVGVTEQDLISPEKAAALSQTTLRFPQIPPAPQFRLPYDEMEARKTQALKARYGAEYDAKMREMKGVKEFERQMNREDIQSRIKDLQDSGVWTKLTPRQQASIRTGATSLSPEYSGVALRSVAGMVSGMDLKDLETDSIGNPIDPKRSYRVARNQDGDIVSAVPMSEDQEQTRPAWIRDPDSVTGFTQLLQTRNGKIVSYTRDLLPPAGYLPTTNDNFRLVPQADGSTLMVPVRTVSGKQLPGGASAPTGAAGGATGIPQPPTSVRPTATVGTGVKVGDKPYSVEEQRMQKNADSGLKAISTVRSVLSKDSLAPLKEIIPGSPGARLYATAKKEAMDVLTRLRTGAALNKDEESFYRSQFPTALDSKETIEYKLKLYEDLFQNLKTRVPLGQASGRQKQEEQMIRVKRKSDGKTGMMPASNFDASKYEKQ